MADSREAAGGTVAAAPTAAEAVLTPHLRYRVAFFLAAVATLALVVILPFSVKSVMDDVLGPATGRVVQITPRTSGPPQPHYARIHLAVTSIDEVQLFATIQVSGHHHCADCVWNDRVLLVSLAGDDGDPDALPPSVAITMTPKDVDVSETVRLPLRGHPVHYPFDRYRMVIAVAYQRVHPDGRLETLSATESKGHLFLSLQELLPRNAMEGPFRLDPRRVQSTTHPFEYVEAFEAWFDRPSYLRVLAAMLVVLIAAAAAYSVFLRSLDDLVVNSGALVLGMWGIRAILTPSTLSYVTAVDLALSTVIIFTLGALCIRALFLAYHEARLNVRRRT